jgi:nucleoid-associated protein EbfC
MPLDLSALLQQAQAMQERMKQAQEKLAQKTVVGSSGGGMVTVTANGKGEIQKVQIDKQAVDPRDVAMLEDLVLAAVNGALKAAQEAQAAEGPLSGLPDLGNLANLFPGGFGK